MSSTTAQYPWQSGKLKNLPIQIIDGDRSARYPKRDEFQKEGILFLNTTNIEQNKLTLRDANFITEKKFAQIKKGRLQRLDIVMTTRGSIGKLALFNCEHSTGLINAQMLILRADGHIIDQKFLFYILCSDTLQSQIKNFSSGSAQPQIPIQDLREIEINYPSLSIQRKIAAILSAYDDLIENNTRRIEILEEMARSLYREWFINFRFPGYEQVKMIDLESRPIPEGWEVKPLSEVCKRINYGYTAKAKAEPIGLKFLRITDIVPHIINWNSVPYCEISDKDIQKFRLEEGDIVIARTGATVGYAKRLNKRHPNSVFASYLVRLRINEQSNSHYIGVIVESDAYKDFIKANMSGAAQPQANAKVLTSFPVVLPAKQLQDYFKNIVGDFFDQREILQAKNANLRQTRDLLLPKLISGEIDVENLDINTEN